MIALLEFGGFLRPYLGRLALSLGLAVVTVLAGVALLGVSGWFITAAALAGGGAAFNLFVPSSLVRGLSMLRIGARYGEKLTGHDAVLRLLSDQRAWLTSVLFPRLPLSRQSPRHGDLVARLTGDLDALSMVLPVMVGPLIASLAAGLSVTGLLWMFLPEAMLPFALCYFVAAAGIPLVLIQAVRGPGREVAQLTADLRMLVFDGIRGHADLLAFGACSSHQDMFDHANNCLQHAKRRLAARNACAAGAIHILAGAAMLIVLWSGLQALQQDAIGGAAMAGMVLATLAGFEAPQALVRGLGRFGQAVAGAERLAALARTRPAVTDVLLPQLAPAQSDLHLHDVGFLQDGRVVLNGITLHVPQGQHVAISGPSGAGKTALLQLLLRLADPSAGKITLGGVDICQLRQADLHSRLSCLEQNAPVFLDTIRGNLLIAAPDATDQDLWQALADAQIADWVKTLPAGLDTMMGEAGSSLSTGQARRLCLARSLLSPAPVLLLDEPTSGLDRPTQMAFLRDLTRAATGRTVIMITHADLPADLCLRRLHLANGHLIEG
ncbi:thiol reductant ABC exporter subunit CydC [Falsirhodobacter sp. alg1]|uniref:thiol reductant ABC exporter subunit CydC n=1 Tax=Falsirhodobacter sp. alg1 TaxID=1472418 RepID=UPI0005EE0D0B|nr:thiol reductant ABC exporter subunit CydC [Falsirhodobacter sp. alg1]